MLYGHACHTHCGIDHALFAKPAITVKHTAAEAYPRLAQPANFISDLNVNFSSFIKREI